MSLPEETRYDCSAKVKNKNDHLMVHWKMWTPATHVYLTARQNGKSSCIALDRSQVQSLRDQLTAWLGDGKPECKCDMRTKLVGDGCATCNPERAKDLEDDQ